MGHGKFTSIELLSWPDTLPARLDAQPVIPMTPNTSPQQETQPHILNAASNLLGICFVLITGLKVSGAGNTTRLDEIAIFTAMLFVASCLLSYASIRTSKQTLLLERLADICFLLGLCCLSIAVLAFGLGFLHPG